MSEIKWRVYEPDSELREPEESDGVYVYIDVEGHEPYGQFTGFCSREEFADLKRRLEGETDEDVLAEIEGAFQDDGGD